MENSEMWLKDLLGKYKLSLPGVSTAKVYSSDVAEFRK